MSILTQVHSGLRDHALCVADDRVTGRWRILPHADRCGRRSPRAYGLCVRNDRGRLRAWATGVRLGMPVVYRPVRMASWLAQPEHWLGTAFVETLAVGTPADALQLAAAIGVQGCVRATVPSHNGPWGCLSSRWAACAAREGLNARLVLHGTVSQSAERILTNGFSLDGVGARGGRAMVRSGVYVTVDPDVALRYADDVDKSMLLVLAAGRSLEDDDVRYTAFCFSGCCNDCLCYHDPQLLLPLCIVRRQDDNRRSKRGAAPR